MSKTNDIERTVVERLCQRNGWPVEGEEYDDALKDVKWFMQELRGPIRRQMLQEVADYLNRKYFNDGCGVSKAYSRTARYSVAKDLLLEIVLLREAQGG